MNGFIETPVNAFVFVVIFFAILVAGALALSKLQTVLSSRIIPGKPVPHVKSIFQTFAVACLGTAIAFGSICMAFVSIQNHNLEWSQNQITAKYNLTLSDEYEGKPTFNFLQDHGKDYWNVEISNNREETYLMELRFDSKSGEPVISFPDLLGVPVP